MWCQIIDLMHLDDTDTISGDIPELAMLVNLPVAQVEEGIRQLEKYGVGDVTRAERDSHEVVTLKSRRMSRELDARAKARDRKRRQREREREAEESEEADSTKEDSHADVTHDVPHTHAGARAYSLSSSTRRENVEEGEKGSPRASDENPVAAYKRITGNACPPYWQEKITAAVGDDEDAREHWAALVEMYHETPNWNSRMVPNMLEKFQKQRERLTNEDPTTHQKHSYEDHGGAVRGTQGKGRGTGETLQGGLRPSTARAAAKKRDGELSNFEYLLRCGYTEPEAHRLAGYGDDYPEGLADAVEGGYARLHAGPSEDRPGDGARDRQGSPESPLEGAGGSELDES